MILNSRCLDLLRSVAHGEPVQPTMIAFSEMRLMVGLHLLTEHPGQERSTFTITEHGLQVLREHGETT